MRSALVFMALLAAQTTSLGEEVVRVQSTYESAPISSHSTVRPAPLWAVAQARQQPPASPTSERLLMILLAAAALGFQLRRKYKTSLRIWQQRVIDDPGDYRLPLREPRRDAFGSSAAVQWQQTH